MVCSFFSRENCKRMDGSRDGSKRTAKTEHFTMLGDTGKQESRGDGTGVYIFLVNFQLFLHQIVACYRNEGKISALLKY